MSETREDRKRRLHREGQRKWRAANLEKVRLSNRRSYLKHRDYNLAAMRKWSRANIDKKRASDKKYREAHIDKYKANWKLYHLANKDKRCANTRRWAVANRDRARAYLKGWWAEHPDAPRIYHDRRRARKAGGGGSHTAAQWVALCWASSWQCFYCAQVLSAKTAVQEHKTPIARGGSDNIENIAVACRSCNQRKHTMTADEFLTRLEMRA